MLKTTVPAAFLFAFFCLGVLNADASADQSIDCVNQEAAENPTVQGIVLVSSCEKLLSPDEAKKVKGVHNVDVALPDGTYRLQDRLYHKVNAPFCKKWLEEVKREVMDYYKECNRPFMIVEIPEQDITDGVVQLVVKEGKIGKITCTGNQYYPDEYFADFLGLKEGQQIVYDVLSQSVAWLGMRPFSKAKLVFKPGEKEGEVDIEIIAEDRKPWRVFAGADNSGTEGTHYGRVFGGAVIDNVFKSGGVLTYQYKSSYDFERMRNNTFGYVVPIDCGHILGFYGTYSTVKPKIRDFKSHGYFVQGTFGYSIPLNWRVCQWLNNIGFGFNYKRLNNNLLFVDNPEPPIIDGGVNMTQLFASYSLGKHHLKHSLTLNGQIIVSPGNIIGQESNHDYQALQNGAHSSYAYLTMRGEYLFYLPQHWTVTLKSTAEASTGTLLPSEQLLLGGLQSVRGYDPGEYLADNGLTFSTELWTPPIDFHLGKIKKTNGYLIFLGFIDSAVGNQYHPLGGTRKTDYMIGIGPALRYKIDPYLEIELDYGYKLHKVKGGSGLDQRLYFSIMASY